MSDTCCLALAASALLAATTPAGAQPTASGAPGAGDRVQARVVAPATGPVGLLCEAQVAGVAGDTLLLASADGCPRGAYQANLRVLRGDRGSRWAHVGVGVIGGALAGGALARVAAGDGCRVAGCDDGDFAVALLTAAGTAAGLLVGGIVGAVLPAGPQWAAAGGPRPLRVAGLALRPGVRVAFRAPAPGR